MGPGQARFSECLDQMRGGEELPTRPTRHGILVPSLLFMVSQAQVGSGPQQGVDVPIPAAAEKPKLLQSHWELERLG